MCRVHCHTYIISIKYSKGIVLVHGGILHYRHGVICGRVILRLDENGVSLCHRYREDINRVRLELDTVSLDDIHVVLVDRDPEHWRTAEVSTESFDEGELYILAKADILMIRILYVFLASKGMVTLLPTAAPELTSSAEG